MKIKINGIVKGKLDSLIKNYYLIIIIIYMLTFWKINIPTGLYSSIVMTIIFISMLSKHGLKIKHSGISLYVVLYFIYSCMSICFSYIEGIPFGTILRAVSNSLFPVMFYWCGEKGYMFSKRSYLLSVNVLCIVGLFLLFQNSPWFVQYCLNYGYSWTRLSSCVGSINIGTLSVVALIYSLEICIESKGKHGKIFYLLSLVYILFSMQRSAWIVGIVSIVVIHYCIFFRWRIMHPLYIFLEIGMLLVVAYIFRENIYAMFTRWMLEHEVNGGYGMISGRSFQWKNGILSSNLLTGSGVGSRGHKAMEYTDVAIADGGWFYMLCEIGIIGMFLFVTAYLKVLKYGIQNFRKVTDTTIIIVIIGLQAIGSNMFEFQIVLPLFWMSIGQIARERDYSINSRKILKT